MSGKKAFVPLAIILAVGVPGTASAAWSSFGGDLVNKTMHMMPCRLDATGYGFVKSRDGTWEVETNCERSSAAAADDPPSPRRIPHNLRQKWRAGRRALPAALQGLDAQHIDAQTTGSLQRAATGR
jgi:hypothetical protein